MVHLDGVLTSVTLLLKPTRPKKRSITIVFLVTMVTYTKLEVKQRIKWARSDKLCLGVYDN